MVITNIATLAVLLFIVAAVIDRSNVKIHRLDEQGKELKDSLRDREKIKMKVMTLCHQAFCIVFLILIGLDFTGVITIPFWLFNGMLAVLLISTIIIWINQRKKKEESIGQ